MALALRNKYSTYPGAAQSGVVVVTGDLIIVGRSCVTGAGTTLTVTDNSTGGTNTYNVATHLEGPGSGGSNTGAHGFLAYAIAKASETLTITTTDGSDSDVGVSVHVVSGNNTTLASVLDQFNSSTETVAGTSHTSSSITTTNADDYLFVLWFQENAVVTLTENGTSFTKQTEQSNHVHQTFDRIVAATGSYSDAMTSSGSTKYGNIIASFKAAGGGVTTTRGTPFGHLGTAFNGGRTFNGIIN